MGKIYKMKDGDSLTIIIGKGKKALKVFREGDELNTKDIESFRKNDNILIMDLKEKKFQHYTFINAVYGILDKSIEDNNVEKKKELNVYVDNLVREVYGKKYVSKDIDIEDIHHFAIAKFKRNNSKKTTNNIKNSESKENNL